MIEKGKGELPRFLKDEQYFGLIRNNHIRLNNESKKIQDNLSTARNCLINGMAFVYDGVFKEEEIDFDFMRKEIRRLTIKLNKLGSITTVLK